MKTRRIQYRQNKKNTKRKRKIRTGGGKRKIKKSSKGKQIKLTEISFKNLQCSPNPEKKKDYTCLDDPTLLKLKDLWNARHPDVKIESKIPKEIWIQLKEYLKSICNKESCWLKQNFVEGKLDTELRDSFAPKSPADWKKNPNEWLSSVDILDVMKQYEKAYKCFEFMGPSPIDFDTKMMGDQCVWEELCKFNLQEQIDSGKTKIGIIFNTDKHTGGGKHWFSLFINIKKGEIFFYDSAGDMAGKEIQAFIDRVIEQGKKLNKPIVFKMDSNYPVEHQMGTTECGVYSLYFIVHMLEDKLTGHYLKTHKIKDKYMQQFRKVYFNEDL
jgi:hypothetical protein